MKNEYFLYISEGFYFNWYSDATVHCQSSHSDEYRTDYKLASSQWETSLQSNAVFHWLGTNLESALRICVNESHRCNACYYNQKQNTRELCALQWRHNEREGVSNHRRLDCLLNCLGADQTKHQSSALLAFVRGIHRWPVDSPHKGEVRRKNFLLMTSSWHMVWDMFYSSSFQNNMNMKFTYFQNQIKNILFKQLASSSGHGFCNIKYMMTSIHGAVDLPPYIPTIYIYIYI